MPSPYVLRDAAEGRLPDWTVVSPERRAHLARVAALVDAWAGQMSLPAEERARWRAAAWLHDALRDAPASDLRPGVPEAFRGWPGALLHGPAAAARLRADGVADDVFLLDLEYHTVGHPKLDQAGRALYLADFLEPGRSFDPLRRAAMRARMPAAMDEVLRRVVRARLRHLLESGRALRPESVGFWNTIVSSR